MSRSLVLAVALLAISSSTSPASEPPPVQLAKVYHLGETIDLDAYLVSEKYDGVRAWWDGKQLLTRSGQIIASPRWFTAHLPSTTLEGELWAGRGQFEATSGTVRKNSPDDAEWRKLRYMVFDLPQHPGRFAERAEAIKTLVGSAGDPWLQAVPQTPVATMDELRRRLDAIVAAGGEGLMLHRRDSLYAAGRGSDLLKLKPYDDAEAVVVEHLPGQGKYTGMLGALRVQRPDGLRFAIGSGLSDEQRRHPPAIGSTITYAYTGTTEDGVPRFARFLRIRE
ncbi:MAG: ligase [Hydrocarboniphaga sp.]|uniref:DNA ligase n=1 Tax=Hydrocarboniphaga sp. TaxID=2033016 RepID=UPI00261DD434|nr:DNA ligase [Hydrocarboniphaga sp.]MDB5967894.1 ligase [Hydrocarboniphaga sp.]